MHFWNLISLFFLAITGVFSANHEVRHHQSTRHELDPNDYNPLLDGWRRWLEEGGQVRGFKEAKSTGGKAFLVGCNFNETYGSVPAAFVTEWNDMADRLFGKHATGWIYSDKYRWAFWRDVEGTVPCPRPYGVKAGIKDYYCPQECALLRQWVGNY